MVVTVWTVLVTDDISHEIKFSRGPGSPFVEVLHVLTESLLAFLAGKSHFHSACQFMFLLFCVTLCTIEPLPAYCG